MAKFYAKAPNGDDAVLSISIQAFTQSLQQNGWCKLPNGLIIQWSVISFNSSSNKRIDTVFPIAFTNIWYDSWVSNSAGWSPLDHQNEKWITNIARYDLTKVSVRTSNNVYGSDNGIYMLNIGI